MRAVTTGRTLDSDRIEILSGLAPGERLARPTTDMDFERARLALLKSLIRLQVATALEFAPRCLPT